MLLHEWKLEEAVVVAKREAAEDKQIEIARKMKNKGFSLNDIAEATDLSIEEILKL